MTSQFFRSELSKRWESLLFLGLEEKNYQFVKRDDSAFTVHSQRTQ